MINTTINSKKGISSVVSKIGYCAFVAISIYFLLTHQIMSAASNLGIALIFDPFNQQQKWNERPLYQKTWLFIHVIFVLGLFMMALILG